jgi:GT2 family glycosyltransferase
MTATVPQRPGVAPPVTIVIPAYGAASELAECLASLVRHAPADCPVVVADDASPDDSVAAVARCFEPKLALTYVRRTKNLGFVENCNVAIREILTTGHDVLLLNSDTEVTAGFLEEMSAVLHLHEKHGAVSPRSNNATIFSVPIHGGLTAAESYDLWTAVRPLLPRYQVMPTAVGFCLLIKNTVLRQLGEFDPIYSPGYNEENDLICRMNRHGYSAIAAHHAFVCHDESSSFGARQKELERRNRRVLRERYPEYETKLDHHMRYGVDAVDHFSPLWGRSRRQTILFDLYHLPAKHSGTSEFALSLLLHLAPRLEDRYDLRLGLSDEAKRFFARELTGYRFLDARQASDERFDLVFKPAQIFTWPELYRMVRLGGRVAYTHFDIIAVRCDYLAGPNTRTLFKTAASLADRVMTLSEFSRKDFEAFYGTTASFDVIHPGTHETFDAHKRGRHVLIVGNAFHHKAVQRAVDELQGLAEIVALGGNQRSYARVTWAASGALNHAQMADLYGKADVVVYPSYYEGFGLPIIDALARGIPVVALDTEVNREVLALTCASRLVLVPDHSQLRPAVASLLGKSSASSEPLPAVRSWEDVAEEYARAFDDLLGQALNVDLIRRRWDMLATIDAVYPLA